MAFFDKVSGTLAARGKDVADKAKELAELNRLNGQIHSQQNKAEKVYMEIGKVVHENRADWKNIDVGTQLALLDSIGNEIAGLEKEVLKVRGVQLCAGCGTEIGRDASFCPKCGTVVKMHEESPADMQGENTVNAARSGEAAASQCPGCGREIEPGVSLCPYCGVRLSGDNDR